MATQVDRVIIHSVFARLAQGNDLNALHRVSVLVAHAAGDNGGGDEPEQNVANFFAGPPRKQRAGIFVSQPCNAVPQIPCELP